MSIIIVTILPLYNYLVIRPSFEKFFAESTNDEAVKIAKYFGTMFHSKKTGRNKNTITYYLSGDIENLKSVFRLNKLKIFSNSGKIIFSSDPKEIGNINNEGYFHEIVSKAKVITKSIQKETESLEGQLMSVDVLEAYVPLMSDGKFRGAFEIYYEITARKQQLDKLLSRSFALVSTIVIGLLLSIIVILFIENKTISKRKQAEDALKRSKQKLRHLSSKLLDAHEVESKRIGQELHDGLAQTLSAIKIWAETAKMEMGQVNTAKAVKALESVVFLAQGAVGEVRRISRCLRPSILDDLGILATISWLCQEFETIYLCVRIERQLDIQETDVPDSLKIVIFRIIQEALNNIARHSKASLVSISLKRRDNKIELTIDDNGEGFDVGNVLSREQSLNSGIGINSMNERTKLSGGSFFIYSIPGRGTTVQAFWIVNDIL